MAKRIGKILLGIFAAFLVLIVGYVAYMQIQYYRIDDFTKLDTENPQTEQVQKGKTYRIMTYNIGFGAYSADYSFFMDTGEMLDGTKTVGKHARALSEKAERENTEGSLNLVKSQEADFIFTQEVDEKADRSYQVNQREIFQKGLSGYGSVFANNFHSAYLFYPFLKEYLLQS